MFLFLTNLMEGDTTVLRFTLCLWHRCKNTLERNFMKKKSWTVGHTSYKCHIWCTGLYVHDTVAACAAMYNFCITLFFFFLDKMDSTMSFQRRNHHFKPQTESRSCGQDPHALRTDTVPGCWKFIGLDKGQRDNYHGNNNNGSHLSVYLVLLLHSPPVTLVTRRNISLFNLVRRC